MKRTNISLTQLIEQGKILREADDRNALEDWHLPADLRDEFDSIYDEYVSACYLCNNLRIDKEASAREARESYFALRKSLNRLKRFIRVVADKETAKASFEVLKIDGKYPTKKADMLFLAKEHIPPKLDDWDGTPHEISPAMKAEVEAACEDFFDKTMLNSRLQDQSQVATADRNVKLQVYNKVLTKILNWLHLMLPHGRYDVRVQEYDFEAWNAPKSNKPRQPKNFGYDSEAGVFRWDSVDGEEIIYELVFRRRYKSGEWTPLYKGPDTQTANTPPAGFVGNFDFRVRAIEGKYRGYWSEIARETLPLTA